MMISVYAAGGYFSIFRRGMVGIYQHCSEKRLHRYLAEFDFRYSNRIKLGVDDATRVAKSRLRRSFLQFRPHAQKVNYGSLLAL